MKRKFLLVFLTVFLISGINVLAKQFEVSFKGQPDTLVVAEYSGNMLSGMHVKAVEENAEKTEFETESEKFLAYLIYDNEIKPAEFTQKQEDEKEQEIIVPEDSKTETEDNKSEVKKEFPDVYDIEVDAVKAIMVVESVAAVFENNETVYEVKVRFHGDERIYHIPEDATINNTPTEYTHLVGADARALERGDILKIMSTFSGKINGMALIFRPTKNNPVFDEADYGNGFYKLFSNGTTVAGDNKNKVSTPQSGILKSGYSYAYGVVTDIYKNEIGIRDKSGEVLLVELATNAIVYTVDTEEKFKVSGGTSSSIRKSSASIKAIDEDGNFLGWPEDKSYNYVFLRTIDGEATEVVVYKNY